jgi:hypothetical protein
MQDTEPWVKITDNNISNNFSLNPNFNFHPLMDDRYGN